MDARESLVMLNKAQNLADTGHLAALAEYLREPGTAEVERSPTLALLYGIAQARLGEHAAGKRWVEVALARSRERGDRAIEARALNASGAIAFEAGRIDEATDYFEAALAEAKREGDHAAVGRCSNNLGIIANLRGDYGRAVGSFTMALAGFQQAGLGTGTAETLHNLAISYRDQGNLESALETADRAVEEAEQAGDLSLAAQTRAGRAEIRLLGGEAQVAHREVQNALDTHRELENSVGEAEDLRVLAGTFAAMGESGVAERVYRDVGTRAQEHSRPLLAAEAERDLALLLAECDRHDEARELARTARRRFVELGAEAEARRLDELVAEPV